MKKGPAGTASLSIPRDAQENFSFPEEPQLPAVLHRPNDLQHGQLADQRRLILLVLKISGSGLSVGLIAACQIGPVLFLSAWAGAIADRSDKRHLLLLTQALEMAQSIGLAILAFMPHPPLGGLYALAVVGGIVLSFDNPLPAFFVSEMVPAEDVPNAVVLYSTIVNVSRIFGPALAGLLAVTLGFGWCFTLGPPPI